MSEFCRGPLSPVPSSGNRRRKRPTFSCNGDTNNSFETDGDRDDQLSFQSSHQSVEDDHDKEEFENENEDFVCSVTLKAWDRNDCPSLQSSSSSTPAVPSSSAIARIPLDVLKSLSLRDGDYAFLEKHILVDATAQGPLSRMEDDMLLLQKVVIRLELMNESEEEEQDTNSDNNCCLVPPIVLANLGISPQVMWQQNRSSFLEEGATFRLRAIHDDEDNSDEDEEDDDGVDGFTTAFTLQNHKSKISLPARRRKRIAGRVLLRPLGRAPLWPWFSLTASTTTKATQNERTRSQESADNNQQEDQSSSDMNRSGEPKNNPITASAAAVVEDEKGNEAEEHDAWIYPSCSGIVLQKSTLCEVRYNTNSNKGNSRQQQQQQQNVCYYEVLRIEEAKETIVISGEEDGNKGADDKEEEDGDDDEVFYLTARCTQFELDSYPLSSQSHIRRLPLPLPISRKTNTEAKATTRGDSSNNVEGITANDEKESQEEPAQEPRDGKNSPMVTPRKLFASSEITPEKPSDNSGDALVHDEAASDENAFSCHPDWKQVAKALLDAPSIDVDYDDHDEDGVGRPTPCGDTSSTDSRILHLIGTDQNHDLQTCVTTAASMVGMQCLTIRGLAAFGYEYRRSKIVSGAAASQETQSGVTVRSAMIEQQLSGIDASFEYIAKRRLEPCVLHLCNVDEELASMATDDQLRCQIEDRFLSKWKEGVEAVPTRIANGEHGGDRSLPQRHRRHHGRSFCNKGGDDNHLLGPLDDRLDYRYTPRIIIVISTKSPLKKGPWLERLVFPSITLSLPNDKYIRYLWNSSGITRYDDDDDDGDLNENNNNADSSVQLTTEMIPLLQGRPAQEIVRLKQQISSEIKEDAEEKGCDHSRSANNNDGGDEKHLPNDGSFQHLEKLCKGIDAGRRTASSDVARISSVSWEDVGGLDHVRAEILDAIELPLKHPHLFPPNTGRSGILLFGPPGTGKTLVAKAVATECGLPFLSVKGPELLGSYIGESEANIRKVFSSARLAAENNRPARASILFFDELDSLAPKRGGTNHGGGVMERVVASLLAELDGGSSNQEDSGRVFVLGATNRPDLLDPSLLRPGRLDRLVYLGIPTDNEERSRVLASQLRKMKLEGDAFEMARSVVEEGLPPRLSGADMSKLSSGAMLSAIRRLCRQADEEREELLEMQQQQSLEGGDSKARTTNNNSVTIDEILESWGEEKCTPIITLDDLRLASKDVSPSVSEEEMQRYERLRAEHETGASREGQV